MYTDGMANKAVARSHSLHRSPLQQEYNIQRVAELKVSGWTAQEIVGILNREMARDLEEGEWRPVTYRMVQNDWRAAHEMWKERTIQDVSVHFERELLALEGQNQEAWRQYRAVTAVLDGTPAGETTRVDFEETGTIESEQRGGNKTTVKRSREELVKEQQYWWNKIEGIAAARRKMLDLDKDGPSLLIDNRRQTVVGADTHQPLKTFAVISPDDWDDDNGDSVAEGEYE